MRLEDRGLSDAFDIDGLEDGTNVLVLLHITSAPPWDPEERREREMVVEQLQQRTLGWKLNHAAKVIHQLARDMSDIIERIGIEEDVFMRRVVQLAEVHANGATEQFTHMAMSITEADDADGLTLYDRAERLYRFYEAKALADTAGAAVCYLVQSLCNCMWETFTLECLETERQDADVRMACRAIDTLYARVPRLLVVSDARPQDIALRFERVVDELQRQARIRWYREYSWLHRLNQLGLSAWSEDWQRALSDMGMSFMDIRRGMERLCEGLNQVVKTSLELGRVHNRQLSYDYANVAWRLSETIPR